MASTLPKQGAASTSDPDADNRRVVAAQRLATSTQVPILNACVARTDDPTAKNWMAAALVMAFPDFQMAAELTHARAAIEPYWAELSAAAEQARDKRLDITGRSEEEPMLALGVVAVLTDFGGKRGKPGRCQLFRLLVELVASDPRWLKSAYLKDVARALRLEFERLAAEPGSDRPTPDFSSAFDALEWFGRQVDRYKDYALASWRRKVAPAIRQALLNPISTPGSGWELGDEQDDPELESELPISRTAGAQQEEDGNGHPLSYWLLPADPGGPQSSARRLWVDEVAILSISTSVPLSKFTEASTTWAFDCEIAAEIQALFSAWHRYMEVGAKGEASLCLARALVAATASPESSIAALRWEDDDDRLSPRHFPGRLSLDARWLNRQELDPSGGSAPLDGIVSIPIPPSLAQRILATGAPRVPGSLVFPHLARNANVRARLREARIPAATMRRALPCRLLRDATYGPSLAQQVSTDDLGINDAPLFYDQIPAAEIATRVAKVTHKWFGDDPRHLAGNLPDHTVGSRRIPSLILVRNVMRSIQRDFQAASGDLALELRHRMRNVAHGLALTCGHRPTNTFERLRIWSFCLEDPIGVVADKMVAADWQVRPIALASKWVEDYRSLLRALAHVRDKHPDTALGQAARDALDGTGPILLDISSIDEVSPFNGASYLDGLPDELLDLTNFARQLLNSQLTRALVHPLRAAQLGWHGSTGGAWEEGSPWSVVSACEQISRVLNPVLKDAGWRPLGPVTATQRPIEPTPVDWKKAERAHQEAFRDQLKRAKHAEAGRDEETLDGLMPRITTALAERARLGFNAEGALVALDMSDGSSVDFSASDQDWVLSFVSLARPNSRESRVARTFLREKLADARSRGVVRGPLPRQVHVKWPFEAGQFLAQSANALAQARRLDQTISDEDVPIGVRTAIALLLHGGYASLDCVIGVMRPGAKLARLARLPGVILAQRPAGDEDASGALAFHGIAALHLHTWHEHLGKASSQDVSVESLNAELSDWLATGSNCPITRWLEAGGMEGVAALARVCNSIRMDGCARLVGTGRVRLTTMPIERVVTIRDAHLVNVSTPPPATQASHRWSSGRKDESQRRTPELLKRLFDAVGDAIATTDHGSSAETAARTKLAHDIRGWIDRADEPRTDELVALFVWLLLVRGGRRRRLLELTTIQGYMYSVARALCEHMPEQPLRSDVDTWERSYLNLITETAPELRRVRLDALVNFHWVLSQEIELPEVDFSLAYELAGSASSNTDAGCLSDAELHAFLSILTHGSHASLNLAPEALHLQKAKLAAACSIAGSAARPGEAARLQFNDLSDAAGVWHATIRKSSIQRLKTSNARRRIPILVNSQTCPNVGQLLGDAKIRGGGRLDASTPLFHSADSARARLQDHELFNGLGSLLRWLTGQPGARLYWLRKTEIRRKLEALMQTDATSLWPTRDFLATVGHNSIRTTLTSYTHDPVTPFVRFFGARWHTISGKRIAVAAGRSVSSVRRRREGDRLREGRLDPYVRLAQLIARLAPNPPSCGTCVELPWVMQNTSPPPPTLTEVSRVLQSLAAGTPPKLGADALRWPHVHTRKIGDLIRLLEVEYGIAFGPRASVSGLMHIPAPRWSSEHVALAKALAEPAIAPTLNEMAGNWLAAMQRSTVRGVPATIGQWEAWEQAAPVLAQMHWHQAPHGRVMTVRQPLSSEAGTVSPWPLLRWMMLVAWFAARIEA